MFDAIKSIIGSVAPTIATALGGPLAGTAVSAIGSVLGLNTTDPKELSNALINITPDQQLALKKADQEFALELKRLNNQSFQAEVDDANSARSREVALSSSKWGWIGLVVQNIGAIVILANLIMLQWYALFKVNTDPQNQTQIISTSLTLITMVVSYWFGKQHKNKND